MTSTGIDVPGAEDARLWEGLARRVERVEADVAAREARVAALAHVARTHVPPLPSTWPATPPRPLAVPLPRRPRLTRHPHTAVAQWSPEDAAALEAVRGEGAGAGAGAAGEDGAPLLLDARARAEARAERASQQAARLLEELARRDALVSALRCRARPLF